MEEYNEVPDILTSKDLDYLKDLFNWNYLVYKETNSFLKTSKDKDVQKIMKKVIQEFDSNMNYVLNKLYKDGYENK